MRDDAAGSRLARWWGLLGLSARRGLIRATRTERQQTALGLVGIAVAVGLMLVVTSVGAGLAQSSSVASGSADYTIVPEGAGSAVMGVEGARLGRVHAVAERLSAREDVTYATPVRTSLIQLRPPGGEARAVLAVGIIPAETRETFVGLPTGPLSPGDPYYAGGRYDGRWTGEAVLSEAAAEALAVSRGDELAVVARGAEDRRFTVEAASPPTRAGLGQFPVVLVHLAELQAVTGGTETDAADQIVVETSADIGDELEAIYPRSQVLARSDLFGGASAGASELPVAISVAALVVAVAVGTLTTMTTLGFEVAAESRERAVMAAIGISAASRIALVVVEVLAVSLLGGVLGVVLWLLGTAAANAAAMATLTDVPIAVVRPVFAAYGLGVALAIGLLAVPYLLLVSWRTGSADLSIG